MAQLGTTFSPAEAAIAEKLLRKLHGTIPDRQLVEEIGLAIAIHRRSWILAIRWRRLDSSGLQGYNSGASGCADDSFVREKLQVVIKMIGKVDEPTDLVVTKIDNLETGTFTTPGMSWSYFIAQVPRSMGLVQRNLFVRKHIPRPL